MSLEPKAQDSNDHIIYNPNVGALLYDPDGKGGRPAIEIGMLEKHLALGAEDLWVL